MTSPAPLPEPQVIHKTTPRLLPASLGSFPGRHGRQLTLRSERATARGHQPDPRFKLQDTSPYPWPPLVGFVRTHPSWITRVPIQARPKAFLGAAAALSISNTLCTDLGRASSTGGDPRPGAGTAGLGASDRANSLHQEQLPGQTSKNHMAPPRAREGLACAACGGRGKAGGSWPCDADMSPSGGWLGPISRPHVPFVVWLAPSASPSRPPWQLPVVVTPSTPEESACLAHTMRWGKARVRRPLVSQLDG